MDGKRVQKYWSNEMQAIIDTHGITPLQLQHYHNPRRISSGNTDKERERFFAECDNALFAERGLFFDKAR